MTGQLRERVGEILALDGKKSGRISRVRFLLSMVKRYLLERLAFFSPSNRFRVWCYRAMGVRIGGGVYIGNYVTFDRIFPHHVRVGDRTSIGDRCLITAHANIPSATPLRAIYPRTVKDTVIGVGVWIMPNCTIAPGVRIGDYAVIATGAVVTKDVPPKSLAAGVPARVVKDLSTHPAFQSPTAAELEVNNEALVRS